MSRATKAADDYIQSLETIQACGDCEYRSERERRIGFMAGVEWVIKYAKELSWSEASPYNPYPDMGKVEGSLVIFEDLESLLTEEPKEDI